MRSARLQTSIPPAEIHRLTLAPAMMELLSGLDAIPRALQNGLTEFNDSLIDTRKIVVRRGFTAEVLA